MSDIKAGDLVMVVRMCCDTLTAYCRAIGVPWRVSKLFVEASQCPHCGYIDSRMADSESKFGNGCDKSPVAWLIKINPPSEDESVERKEELHA